MSRQLQTKSNPTYQTSSFPPQVVSFDTRTIGAHEKIQLLKALSMESNKIWKNRAFNYAYNRLRAKLCTRADNEFRPDTLITVFSEHFPPSTQNAEHDAELAVQNFRTKFQNVSLLTPMGFFDVQGNLQCYHMTKKDRPPNVCYLKVKAELPLSEFSPKFKGKTCRLEYYLHLPQSNNFIDQSIVPSDSISTDNLYTPSMFDDVEGPKHVLHSMFDDEAQDDNAINSPTKQISSKRLLENPMTPIASSKRSHKRFEETEDGALKETPVDKLNDNVEGDVYEPNENSNDSFDFQAIAATAPKLAAQLLSSRATVKKGLAFTYYGPLNILDDQSTYVQHLPRRMELFDLKPDIQGIKNIVTYDDVEKTIQQMCYEIIFETFCHEFKCDYVGEEDDAELAIYTIDKIREELSNIKMIYTNRLTSKLVYTSPETVFKKMNQYLELLPQDATTWSFCLPWLYYAALPSDLQQEMNNSGFKRPSAASLTTKKLQSKSLSQCRDSAVKAYNRLQETHRQLKAMINIQHSYSRASIQSHFTSLEDTSIEQNEVSEQTVAPFRQFVSQHHPRAETTLHNAYDNRKRSEFLPNDFTHVKKTIEGVQYPCHPSDPTRWSAFPVGFRGCYYCGETNHGFSTCPKKSSVDASIVFHWNLHSHKPELWFKHKDRRQQLAHQSPTKSVQFSPPVADTINSGPVRGLGRGKAAVISAWASELTSHTVLAAPDPDDNIGTEAEESGKDYLPQDKNTSRSYVQIVRVHKIAEQKTRRMPIASQNELPHLQFSVGQPTDSISLSFLYDTGAAINTGYLLYHLYIMQECPTIVHSFEEFNGANPFEPIKLCGAITDPLAYDVAKHGILSAVVRYRTPYVLNTGEPFILAFALGSDMSVNSIFGLPGILEAGLEPRFGKGVFLAHHIKAKFNIEFNETSKANVMIEGNKYVLAKTATTAVNTIKQEPYNGNIPLAQPQSAFFDTFSTSTAAIIQAASNTLVEPQQQLE